MAEEPLPSQAHVPRACRHERRLPTIVAPIKYKLEVDTLEQVAATQLDLDEIGVVHVELGKPVAFDQYADNRDTGGFVLIDRITNHTVGAGLLIRALPRSETSPAGARRRSRWRAAQGAAPVRRWLTGRSGAGKSSIASALEFGLYGRPPHRPARRRRTCRRGCRRIASATPIAREQPPRDKVARLMTDAGLITCSPRSSPVPRRPSATARSLFDEGVHRGLRRPARGARRRARHDRPLREGGHARRAGFPHRVDSTFEDPEGPDVHLDVDEARRRGRRRPRVALLGERRLLA